DDLLAGPHVLAAAEVGLDDADKLVVEIAIEDRGEQRQHRDEHREIGEQRRADRAFLVAHGPARAPFPIRRKCVTPAARQQMRWRAGGRPARAITPPAFASDGAAATSGSGRRPRWAAETRSR